MRSKLNVIKLFVEEFNDENAFTHYTGEPSL